MSSSNLSKIIHHSTLEDVVSLVDNLEEESLAQCVASLNDGIFHYSSLHEAVSCGKADILDYLLTKTKDAYVNLKDSSGYTLLHIAACSGQYDCLETLLRHGADVRIRDGFGKTPAETADLCCHMNILRTLRNEELLKQIELDDEGVTEQLKKITDHLDNNYLDKWLLAATSNGNVRNMVKIIMKGARNFDECLKVAHELSKSNATAQLLLYQAAITGNRNLLQDLFSDSLANLEHSYKNFITADIRKSVKNKVSKMTPMIIARRQHHFVIQHDLMMKIGTNIQTATIDWHELGLSSLELPWLQSISWVKNLKLNKNSLKELPASIGFYLKAVTFLDLKYNNLVAVPPSLFEMPALCELYLKHNCLTELPAVPTWPSTLMILDVSHNNLSSLPTNTIARRIRSINLSHNKLHSVPSCICTFPTLCTLILDANPDIVSLPRELGKLKKLNLLSLRDLDRLVNPPKIYHHETRSCLKYLRNVPEENSQPVCFTNLMVVGPKGKGKSTFVNVLMASERSSKEKLTKGVRAISWKYSSSIFKCEFDFQIWDFSGDDANFHTHHILGFHNSLYAIVFNLNDGVAGIEELKPWLNIISQTAPHSKVVVVGTHVDEMTEEKKRHTDEIFKQILDMADGKIQILDLIAFGLENGSKFHDWLMTTICRCAKFLNNQIADDTSSAFTKLNADLKLIQQKAVRGTRSPFMHMEELKTLVLASNIEDIKDDVALKKLIEHICNTGALVRFSGGGNGLLKDFFCVDSQWLSQVISSLTQSLEQSRARTEILELEDFHNFFKISRLPCSDLSEHFAAFVESLVTGICFSNKILFPFLFPSEEPHISRSISSTDISLYHRSITFKTGIPAGFWNLLLCQIFQTVSVIQEEMVNRLQVVDQHTAKDVTAKDVQEMDSTMTNNTAKTNESSDNLDIQSPESLRCEHQLPTLSKNTTPMSTEVKEVSHNNTSHEVVNSDLEPKYVMFHYWKTGIFYQNSSTMLCVKSFPCVENSDTDKILISSFPDDRGKKLVVQVADLIYSVTKKWYCIFSDDLQALEHSIACSKSTNTGCKFSFHQCLTNQAKNISDINCNFANTDECHSVSISDIAPDVPLYDINLINVKNSDIAIDEDEKSLLGENANKNTVILKGTLQGKPVTVEKYLAYSAASFQDMRMKLKELNKIRHPCLVSIIGTCLNPLAIVMERSPLNSLSSILKKQTCIPRITFFRIAAEVAAALRFLHRKGIILGRFNATNVIMWTLDPNSLCHCKLAIPTTSDYFPELLTEPLQSQKGFTAPEVLEIGTRKHTLKITQEADSFSFGMLLTQVLTRQDPYHFTHPSKVDEKVLAGVRPKLEGVVTFQSGYSYLSMLLKKCREPLPEDRPTMDEIVSLVTSVKTQLLIGVSLIGNEHAPCCTVGFSLRDAKISTTLPLQDELWMFYKDEKEQYMRILDSHSLVHIYSRKIAQAEEIKCGIRQKDQIWVSSRCGSSSSQIDVYSAIYRAHMHKLDINEIVTCMAAVEENAFIGTQEGGVFTVAADSNDSSVTHEVWRTQDSINSMITTGKSIWISHGQHIDFLSVASFKPEGSVKIENKDIPIGQLLHDASNDLVWSIHYGQPVLTAWGAQTRLHEFDVVTLETLGQISGKVDEKSFIVTAATIALDTLWIGMKTGHMLIFHKKSLLLWFQPFTSCVSLLVAFPMVVDEGERIRVMSYGTGNGLNDAEYDVLGLKGSQDKKNYLAIWDAYNSQSLKQLRLVEENSLNLFDSLEIMEEVVKSGEFTGILSGKMLAEEVQQCKYDSLQAQRNVENDNMISSDSHNQSEDKDMKVLPENLDLRKNNATCQISVDTGNTTFQFHIPKPPLFETLRCEIEKALSMTCSTWRLSYVEMGENIIIDSQEQMDDYWSYIKRPILQLKELD